MRKVLAWVIGQGLLGLRLVRSLPVTMPSATVWENPVGAFCWTQHPVLSHQMTQAVTAFAASVREGYDHWLVLWTAGSGVVGTCRDFLSTEVQTWELFLDLVQSHLLEQGRLVPGTLFLASSAGGVFGNAGNPVLTEESPCRPLSDYGRCKLLQEEALFDWASQDGLRCLVGRISNLYGPGQKLNKGQGLISHLCRCAIHQRPAHIYVPLDTSRDYLYVDDAAELILRCVQRLMDTKDESRMMKLLASAQTTSIAQVVGTISRMARRKLRIVCSPSPLRIQQAERLQFRSTVWPDLHPAFLTPLSIGIGRVFQHQLSLFCRGKLPQPV